MRISRPAATLLALLLAATASADRAGAGARASRGSLAAPEGVTLLVDFTDGTHTLGIQGDSGNDIVKNAGFPAGGCDYTLDATGLTIVLPPGLAGGAYCSAKYEPGRASKPNLDLSGGAGGSGNEYLSYEFEVPEGTGTYFHPHAMFLTEDAGTIYSKYTTKTITSGADKLPHKDTIITVRFATDGWTTPGGGGAPTGWPMRMTSIAKLDFRLVAHNNAAYAPFGGWIKLKRIWKGKPGRGRLIWSMDDFYITQYTNARSIFGSYGYRATLWGSMDHIDGGIYGAQSGKMNPDQIAEMYNAGWAVSVHGNVHGEGPFSQVSSGSLTRSGNTCTAVAGALLNITVNIGDQVQLRGAMDPAYTAAPVVALSKPDADSFTFDCGSGALATAQTPAQGYIWFPRLSEQQVKSDWTIARDFMRSKGWARDLAHMSYPNGLISEWNLPWMASLGFKSGRGTGTGASPMAYVFDTRIRDRLAWLQLPAKTADQSSVSDLTTILDTAISRGAVASIYAHGYEYGVNQGTQRFLDAGCLDQVLGYVRTKVRQGLIDPPNTMLDLEDRGIAVGR
ncbi:MAG: hypothetical protein AB7N65_14175 [Vicinamibacterales bacterium]